MSTHQNQAPRMPSDRYDYDQWSDEQWEYYGAWDQYMQHIMAGLPDEYPDLNKCREIIRKQIWQVWERGQLVPHESGEQ